MSRPIYSVVFVDQHAVTLAGYTTPPGFVAVVRDIDLFYSGGAGTLVNVVGVSGGTFAYAEFPPAASGAYNAWRGRQVFEVGQTWEMSSSDGVDIRVSGYLLTAP